MMGTEKNITRRGQSRRFQGPEGRFRLRGIIAVLVLFCLCLPVYSQTEPAADPASFVGLTLAEVLLRFGAPKSVYPVRGVELWQDDVVFEYDDQDLYIYKDRVWQVGLKAVHGISLGDRRAAVLTALGAGYQNFEDHILFPLPSRGWPLTLRINLNLSGSVSAIYIYRSDF
jgi:hypothetical protein